MKPTRETEDTLEWSRPCGDWQLPDSTPRRLHVSINDDTHLIDVVECEVTSKSDSAQRLRPGKDTHALILTQDEARWLLQAVAAALECRPPQWDETDEERAQRSAYRTIKAWAGKSES